MVAAVDGRAEVLLDTGITDGADIVAAVANGASACLVGRAYLYGLMAGGERGVDKAIEILADQVGRTMRLLGVSRLEDLTPDHARIRPSRTLVLGSAALTAGPPADNPSPASPTSGVDPCASSSAPWPSPRRPPSFSPRAVAAATAATAAPPPAAWSARAPATTASSTSAVPVGAALSLTGAAASYGESQQKGIQARRGGARPEGGRHLRRDHRGRPDRPAPGHHRLRAVRPGRRQRHHRPHPVQHRLPGAADRPGGRRAGPRGVEHRLGHHRAGRLHLP